MNQSDDKLLGVPSGRVHSQRDTQISEHLFSRIRHDMVGGANIPSHPNEMEMIMKYVTKFKKKA